MANKFKLFCHVSFIIMVLFFYWSVAEYHSLQVGWRGFIFIWGADRGHYAAHNAPIPSRVSLWCIFSAIIRVMAVAYSVRFLETRHCTAPYLHARAYLFELITRGDILTTSLFLCWYSGSFFNVFFLLMFAANDCFITPVIIPTSFNARL